MMKIAIDGMGGDNAPAEIVSGVIKALEEFKDIEFLYNWSGRVY